MSFFDGKYTPFDEWDWKYFTNSKKTNLEDFIVRYPEAEFYIGTDSQNYSKKGNRYCVFTTVLVAYTRRRGGNAIFCTEKLGYAESLRQKLLTEAMRSIEVGWYLDRNKHVRDNQLVTIHLDVNCNLKFKSTKYKDELVGLVTAQGFECEHKPNAWAATTIADSKC